LIDAIDLRIAHIEFGNDEKSEDGKMLLEDMKAEAAAKKKMILEDMNRPPLEGNADEGKNNNDLTK
jgi:hypothetical protein